MNVDGAFTGLAVTDLAAGRDFYERLFGKPADIEVAVDEVMWRLSESAWLYIVVDTARAGSGLAALAVSDLTVTLAELEDRGITPVSVEQVGPGARKATMRDPDGNTVAVIEVRA
jgi:catechol 2,3-dioxygenase-like lactoylglutathione lyase family enzyme